jgi:TolB-like protein/Flp pilus assembly protein TadD
MVSFGKIRQRKLVQWAVAYLAAAWLILQVLSLLAEPFAWPSVVLRAATVLLAVGFIAVLVLAWYHGERGRQHVSGIELILLAVVLVLAGAAVWWVRDESPAPDTAAQPDTTAERNSIAVLPFVDLSPARDNEYFSDGITEEILNALAKVERLRVASRTSSFSFKGRNVPVDEIGQRLRVQHVLEGSVQKAGERIRVNAQLIDAANGFHLWSERYDRELNDIFAVEDEISRAIVESLELEITGGQQNTLVTRTTESQEAHDLYLKGRYFWVNRTPEGLRRSVQYFEQAIQIDPDYARAHQGLADALLVLPIYTDVRPAEVQPRAKEAALTAVALDPELGEAQASLGYVKMSVERDWKGAGESLRMALQLAPNYATAHQWYGDWLAAQGRVDESVSYYERAARLDPLSATIAFSRGWLYLAQRKFADAIAQLEESIELDSSLVDAYTLLGRTRLYQGLHEEAIAGLEDAVVRSGRRSRELSFLGYAYAVTGRRADAEQILDQLAQRGRTAYVSPLDAAFVYIGLGDNDRAFAALDKARQEGDPWLTENGFDPSFDPLRSDARWIRLRKEMGLPAQ